jgi:hypothetical protein
LGKPDSRSPGTRDLREDTGADRRRDHSATENPRRPQPLLPQFADLRHVRLCRCAALLQPRPTT